MGIIEDAYKGLSDKPFSYAAQIGYNSRFKGYNANIQLRGGRLILALSKKWKPIDRQIQIGLIQELIVKLFKKKINTLNMELYNHFIKSVHLTAPKTKTEPLLESSFIRVNENFFYDVIEKPNLCWSKSLNRVGSYEFGTDTITISKCLREDFELLDYVMHHELLHKQLKFKSRYGKIRSHTKLFREKEALFPNQPVLEQRLRRICSKNRLKRMFGIF